jgi:hypothetical protein
MPIRDASRDEQAFCPYPNLVPFGRRRGGDLGGVAWTVAPRTSRRETHKSTWCSFERRVLFVLLAPNFLDSVLLILSGPPP